MAQDLKKVIERLNDLIALDIDAVGAYEAANKHIDHTEVVAKMSEFQADHERHVRDLSAVVRQLGGEPRKKPDVKGVMLKSFTAATARMGTTAALRAMQGNEVLTNRIYKNALDEEWTVEVRALLERNYADERRHLAYIEDALRTRFWEQAPAQP